MTKFCKAANDLYELSSENSLVIVSTLLFESFEC